MTYAYVGTLIIFMLVGIVLIELYETKESK